jgi:hypothetical protein
MVPDQPFLGYGSYQDTTPCLNFPFREAPGFAGLRTLHHIEEPVIDPEGPVKPHGVTEAGHLHLPLPEIVPIGIEGGRH